ncbi:hypothetical protein [Nocardiopsis dassonvillei]|uniref:hypothetical protein n=1 Tax=Nocardiopsis dassonvillei TaxID=2014 RepID=UPI00157C2891|nr:hypothetical protein [Nocardiopsis dassonvillei]
MTDSTGSAHVDRLITLLMMLPAPHQEGHSVFWEAVAEEQNITTGYITGNIASGLEQILINRDPSPNCRVQLATDVLYYLGEPSEKLISQISSSVDRGGAPNHAAGRAWVHELRTTAFAVIEEAVSPDQVRKAVVAWVRAGHARMGHTLPTS